MTKKAIHIQPTTDENGADITELIAYTQKTYPPPKGVHGLSHARICTMGTMFPGLKAKRQDDEMVELGEEFVCSDDDLVELVPDASGNITFGGHTVSIDTIEKTVRGRRK